MWDLSLLISDHTHIAQRYCSRPIEKWSVTPLSFQIQSVLQTMQFLLKNIRSLCSPKNIYFSFTYDFVKMAMRLIPSKFSQTLTA